MHDQHESEQQQLVYLLFIRCSVNTFSPGHIRNVRSVRSVQQANELQTCGQSARNLGNERARLAPQAKEQVLQANVADLQARVEELRLRRVQLTQQNSTLKETRAALWAAEGVHGGPCWPWPSQPEPRREADQVSTGADAS